MKKLLLSLFFSLVLGVSSAFAWSLVCDPQTGVTHYDVEVNGTTIAANYPAEIDGSINYNIDHLSGQATFRLQAYMGLDTWGSGWSVPFDATKPGGPGNARIVKDTGD